MYYSSLQQICHPLFKSATHCSFLPGQPSQSHPCTIPVTNTMSTVTTSPTIPVASTSFQTSTVWVLCVFLGALLTSSADKGIGTPIANSTGCCKYLQPNGTLRVNHHLMPPHCTASFSLYLSSVLVILLFLYAWFNAHLHYRLSL